METPEKCPLCGGRAEPITVRGLWLCEQCSLPADLWPRVAKLVAIRDAAMDHDHHRVEYLVMKEAEREAT